MFLSEDLSSKLLRPLHSNMHPLVYYNISRCLQCPITTLPGQVVRGVDRVQLAWANVVAGMNRDAMKAGGKKVHVEQLGTGGEWFYEAEDFADLGGFEDMENHSSFIFCGKEFTELHNYLVSLSYNSELYDV
jgi:hypothetical protein